MSEQRTSSSRRPPLHNEDVLQILVDLALGVDPVAGATAVSSRYHSWGQIVQVVSWHGLTVLAGLMLQQASFLVFFEGEDLSFEVVDRNWFVH